MRWQGQVGWIATAAYIANDRVELLGESLKIFGRAHLHGTHGMLLDSWQRRMEGDSRVRDKHRHISAAGDHCSD